MREVPKAEGEKRFRFAENFHKYATFFSPSVAAATAPSSEGAKGLLYRNIYF